MRVLFDNGVPRPLRRYLKPHDVKLAKELGWAAYGNGELLSRAEREFDVLITTDSNIPYQQNLARYAISLIVLRAYTNELFRFVTMLPAILDAIERLAPGEDISIYEDERLRQMDERKGQKK